MISPTRRPFLALFVSLCLGGAPLFADPPQASYIFPAGGQKGQSIKVRVGGLFLHHECSWELLGAGVKAGPTLKRTATRWFEGPLLPLPDSQQKEDYPQDMAGVVAIAADAEAGVRRARLWTSEGASSGLAFVVGELPEVVEEEADGEPVPVPVTLPVTINGRIFPREDIDDWAVTLKKGQALTAEVHSARLGFPLDPRLEVLGPEGRVLAENDDFFGRDSLLHFTASEEGTYRVRIQDANRQGGQAFVYRLTLTTGPHIDRTYPLGGRRGSKVPFELAGPGCPCEPVVLSLPASAVGPTFVPVALAGQKANAVQLDLDDLPEFLEGERLPVAVPAVLTGRIERPGEADAWTITARKADTLLIELRAQVLRSPLQGVVEVTDSSGKVLARAEAAGTPSKSALRTEASGLQDPVLTFRPPADGTYTVSVRDRFHTRGGPAFAYRLRIRPAQPDYRLRLLADALSVPRGKSQKLRVQLDRLGGFNAPVALTVEGLPEGVRVAPLSLGPGQGAGELTFSATDKAVLGARPVRVVGTAKVDGKEEKRTASFPAGLGAAPVDSVLLGVGLTAPFKVVGTYDLRLAPRGSVFRKRYKVERGGYAGPLEVRLADRQARHLQGVTGPVLTVPVGVDEFEYPVTLPPWMETGRTSRACVMATGWVEEGGIKHAVSYSSEAQNEQIIAVVETGRLGLEAGLTSAAARPGSKVEVPVRVRRAKGLAGAVRVELVVPEGLHGLSAEPLTIPADATEGRLTLRFAPEVKGSLAGPVLLRATLAETVGPVTAEAKLEVAGE